MTLITKGMGVIRKAIKKGTKSVKQGFTKPTTDKPFYVGVGATVAGTITYKKVKEKIKEKIKEKRRIKSNG